MPKDNWCYLGSVLTFARLKVRKLGKVPLQVLRFASWETSLLWRILGFENWGIKYAGLCMIPFFFFLHCEKLYISFSLVEPHRQERGKKKKKGFLIFFHGYLGPVLNLHVYRFASWETHLELGLSIIIFKPVAHAKKNPLSPKWGNKKSKEASFILHKCFYKQSQIFRRNSYFNFHDLLLAGVTYSCHE